ncbi:GNAT family N-acetyltransferase [Alkalihalobacillus sp. MEB130]|uniref:GNAT family N-acetyltransferase n=1 Tax=Alkalihalobacillus sp. MEB130 TaxID=2976704 RepID=UPI0028E05AD1|nr:GNAT family N-acetyltransferase [Alkalihalobacillus sp. MEB130]MDT8861033.1 GNAT family N-acetyltransferase [Alkalihalobacillus sp. MEB130]
MNIRALRKTESAPMDLLLDADPSQTLVEDYLSRGICYVAEIGNHIVGVYVLLPTRPDTIELVNIAILKQEQGKGFGKTLVLDAVNQARARGYKTVEIGTGNSSIQQLALYQKCGFRICGIDVDFFIRHYSEDIYENGIHCRDMIRLYQDL